VTAKKSSLNVHPLHGKPIVVKRMTMVNKQRDVMIEVIRTSTNEKLPLAHYYIPLAGLIKAGLDERLGGSWQCIVGSHFSLGTNCMGGGTGFGHFEVGPYINIVVYNTSRPSSARSPKSKTPQSK